MNSARIFGLKSDGAPRNKQTNIASKEAKRDNKHDYMEKKTERKREKEEAKNAYLQTVVRECSV
jgi:hypothetical protein